MKLQETLIAVVVTMLTYSVANAQDYRDNYQSNANNATQNSRGYGRIIGIGNPIVKNSTVQVCSDNDRYQSNGYQRDEYQGRQQQNRSDINAGTIIGGITGGALGSQFGKGNGKTAAIAFGAVTGAMIGNNQSRQNDYDDRVYENHGNYRNQNTCQQQNVQQIIGYNITVQYENIQIQGVTHKQPYVGDQVEVNIRSTFSISQ
jgi:uncharacterized protein YcfJ